MDHYKTTELERMGVDMYIRSMQLHVSPMCFCAGGGGGSVAGSTCVCM
jgi:hypothetical protein